MAIRRWHAQKVRDRYPHWPILETTASPPCGWPGWPSGHPFAFLATHDIEGPAGLARVRRLAELELSLGFRSVFNFIPEGPYSVPPELRKWLVERGFEVGVHDLKHDGGLYVTRSGFRRRARRINHYLAEWAAVGFRSGFMLRELDWLHDLNLRYDASTFDFDPFEPQPDGAGTIFPFLVSQDGPSGGGVPASPSSSARNCYVELPYTLPQDSTLFLLLRERNPETWLRKLNWLAAKGGMALVNVHPDYLRFPEEPADPNGYPVEHYRQLLQAVRDRPEPAWCPLARELAAWYRDQVPGAPPGARVVPGSPAEPPAAAGPSLRGRRVAVVLYSRYPADSRPRRAAEALVQAGAQVELICPQEIPPVAARERVGGVEVTRVRLPLRRGGKFTYLYQYGAFLLASGLRLSWRALDRRYDAVHIHNMPDFLVWAAWLPKLRGARIILDLHDPMPELFMSLYRRERDNWMIRGLAWVEQQCVAFADLVLTPNEAFRQRFVSRSGAVGKIQVIMNSPEEDIFEAVAARVPAASPAPEFRLMHHGLIAERHGLDVAVEAIASLRDRIPGLTLDLFGERTPFLDHILELARTRGISDRVKYHGLVPEREIARHIRHCDLGLIPNRRSPFTELNLPTRIFEYLAQHCPVIVPATAGIQDYFGADEILYFQPDDATDLARQIHWVHGHREEAGRIAGRGHAVYQRHVWRNERVKFLHLISGLFQSDASGTASTT